MTDKAYIVANEQQEHEVLEKLERKGLVWIMVGKKPTEWVPSHDAPAFIDFPIILTDKGRISWAHLSQLDNEEIVYDGRKEDNMSEKYVVSQKFMNELKKWKDNLKMNGKHSVYDYDIHEFSDIIEDWWSPVGIRDYEQNNRLIAILRWVNGEDVFEIEKPKKWIVRSKETDSKGSHLYVFVSKDDALPVITSCFGLVNATHFDTKEDAQEWCNSHQEVIEVDE